MRVENAGRDKALTIAAPGLLNEIVVKGSIAIDGISLTVVDVSPAAGTFTVHVIPHTWRETALAGLKPGARINLETDLIGKYVRAALASPGGNPSPLSWDQLRAAGFLA